MIRLLRWMWALVAAPASPTSLEVPAPQSVELLEPDDSEATVCGVCHEVRCICLPEAS